MPEETVQALNSSEKLLIDQAIAEHGDGAGALLGILEDVQAANAHKFLSLDTLRYIAAKTGIPPATVYSVATFYALFNLEPQGDNVVCVCRGTACHTRGSRDLLAKLCLDLGLSEQEHRRLQRCRQSVADDEGSSLHGENGGVFWTMRTGAGG